MRSASACLLSFALLAGLVAAGVLAGLDQWAVDHVMPGARFAGGEATVVDALVPLAGAHWDSGWSIATNVVTLPAGLLVSFAITWWRSRLLAVVLVAATGVETVCKAVLERPELHHRGRHLVAFDASFPSGHALRAVLVAAVVSRPYGVLWACAAVVLLELGGWHTPSDIAGGLLLGLGGLLGARALGGGRLLRRGA